MFTFVEPKKFKKQWFLLVFGVSGSEHVKKAMLLFDFHICGAQQIKKAIVFFQFLGANTRGHPGRISLFWSVEPVFFHGVITN